MSEEIFLSTPVQQRYGRIHWRTSSLSSAATHPLNKLCRYTSRYGTRPFGTLQAVRRHRKRSPHHPTAWRVIILPHSATVCRPASNTELRVTGEQL